MPTCFAITSAVRWLSPVIITTSSPSWRSSAMASREPGLTVSATATSPISSAASSLLAGRTATEHRGLPFGLQPCDVRLQRLDRDPFVLHHPRVADDEALVFHGGPNTEAADCLEGKGIHKPQASPCAGLDDRAAQGMLRAALGAGSQAQHLLSSESRCAPGWGLTACRRARLSRGISVRRSARLSARRSGNDLVQRAGAPRMDVAVQQEDEER